MTLHLASGLHLPLDAATQTFLIVGKRGSGKSSTGTRLAEQLIRAEVPVAVLDPVDVWWGLKAGKDGRPDGGLSVYVFGGDHADLPLEPTAGVLMADVVVDHRVSVVFVLRTFSNREKARFVADFAEQLFKRNREVLHLFAEEAHELMPQQPFRGEEEMLGRMLRLQKLGRTSGIGLTCITQRPASLNKNATTQAEILIAHRILGPQDRDAVEGWIKHHRQEERKKEVLTTLPELKTGEAWIWAPDFPEEKPLGLRRTKVSMPDTFDSRRTPKPGEKRLQPKALATVDLEKLRSKMAATIERAKGEDPRELRRQMAELRQQLTQSKAPAPARVEIKEREIVKPAMVQRIERLVRKIERVGQSASNIQVALAKACEPLGSVLLDLDAQTARLSAALTKTAGDHNAARTGAGSFQMRIRGAGAGYVPPDLARPSPPSGQLPVGPRRILTTIAQDAEGVSRDQLSVLTGYKRSTRDTYLQRLRERHLIELAGDRIVATAEGTAALGSEFEPLPTGLALLEYWMTRLPRGEQAVFKVVVDAYPKAVDREHISEIAEYKRSTRDTYLQRLISRRLVVAEERGQVRAADELFR